MVHLAWPSAGRYHHPLPPPSHGGERECTADDAAAAEDATGLLRGAHRRGMLPWTAAARQAFGAPEPLRRQHHVRLRWTMAGADEWEALLQLQFAVRDGEPEAFRRAVLRAARPRCPLDVPRWLASVGAEGTAEWRVEVEIRPPHAPGALARGLFLHHLLRLTAVPNGAACLPHPGLLPRPAKPARKVSAPKAVCPRTRFCELFERHVQPAAAAAPTGRAADFVRERLADAGRRLGLTVAPGTGYPWQPRPRDLIERDFDRLAGCVVTPKINGLEAFLVGHAYGCAVVLRSGDVSDHPWPAGEAYRPHPLRGPPETVGRPPPRRRPAPVA